MLAFVTVGSTRFDSLVQAVLSSHVLSHLLLKGYSHLIIQCGISELVEMPTGDVFCTLKKDGIDIEIWRFKPSLEREYECSDLVISHAGLLHLCQFRVKLSLAQVRALYSTYYDWASP